VFLGFAHTQSSGRHVRVEILLQRVGSETRRYLDVLGLLAGFAIFALIFWSSLVDTWVAWVTGDYTLGSVAFAVWPSKLMIPVGSFFLCLRLLVQIVSRLHSREAEAR
jgi:TRAP-type mannitol/chloroaromatic compound transport system permease small subunit